MQARNKWQQPEQRVTTGSVVLIIDERYPPAKWPLARIIETHPGKDGLVRVVTIRTAVSTFKRPIHKLCPLPITD
ncbi:hypothetical protein X777_16730 [Ooceraea biroi]|nr:hypothetical protein X777_16730 [Ooceraea biroi]